MLKQMFKTMIAIIIYHSKSPLIFIMGLRFFFRKRVNTRYILVGSPDHGNVGDIAIAIAIKKFIVSHFSNVDYVDINMQEYYKQITALQKNCGKKDVFLFVGGGNFGNQYIRDEKIRRDVISRFPENKIIMFPQSMYFTGDEIGAKELEISKKIYNNHKNLTLFARDDISYELMKKEFTCGVFIAPDIVFTLDESNEDLGREYPLLCIRDDVEGCLSLHENQVIREKLAQHFGKPIITDTIMFYWGKSYTGKMLELKLQQFRCARLVVTDRLHGMIFAAITSTPCIVFSNYNHKIEGAYRWISDFDHIKFAKSLDEYIACLEELKNVQPVKYSPSNFMPHYKKLIESLSE